MGKLSDTVGASPLRGIHHPRRLDPGPHRRLRRTDRRAGGGCNPGVGRRAVATASFRPPAFTAPASGTLSIHPRSLRRGWSATGFAVEGISAGQVASTASLIFRGPRVGRRIRCSPHPRYPDRIALSSRIRALSRRRSSATSRSVAGGAAPDQRRRIARVTVLVRHLDATGIDPDVALVALGDALPPAATTAFTDWAPISTMSWTINICADKPVDPNGWFLLRSVAPSPTVATRPSR